MLRMNHSKMFRRLEKTSVGPKIDEQNSKWLKRQLENHWVATLWSTIVIVQKSLVYHYCLQHLFYGR